MRAGAGSSCGWSMGVCNSRLQPPPCAVTTSDAPGMCGATLWPLQSRGGRRMSEILPLQSRKPLLNLQFLRGVGALLVVADHAIARLVKHGGYPSAYEQLAWRVGTVGVEVFFAISGFIMVYT